jgi:hypothetical protein
MPARATLVLRWTPGHGGRRLGEIEPPSQSDRASNSLNHGTPLSVPPQSHHLGRTESIAATGATLGPSAEREAGHDDSSAFAKLGGGPRGRGLVQRDADACCGPCPSMERDRTARGWPRQRVHPVAQLSDHAPRGSRRGYRRDWHRARRDRSGHPTVLTGCSGNQRSSRRHSNASS